MKIMIRIITLLLIVSFFSRISAYTQVMVNVSGKDTKNAILPDKCYIKYIYEFPHESKPVFYSERFPDLETRKYLNSDLIVPIFNRILKNGYQVSDPNWWGSIKELVNNHNLPAIDTNRILKYMHAGWDTTFSIDENNLITTTPIYTHPDYSDISGLFFFESWNLNPKKGFLNKEVVAYFPIYEYWDESELERGDQVKLKRLVCMIYQGEQNPQKTNKAMTVSGSNGYKLIYKDIKSELNLYNRPYTVYLHRDHNVTTDNEYNEWEYHTFDFYKDFNTERFLESIINLTIEGKFIARDPSMPGKILAKEEFLQKIYDKQDNKIIYNELNSVVFNEDWYLNPESLFILKKVNSITIVKHEYQFDEYTGDFLRVLKTPLITISLK
jgi:hypothetical protein